MTTKHHAGTALEPDADALPSYRSLSVLAVVALLLGLLSVVALQHPGAWAVPIAAIGIGTAAIARLRRRADVLMGMPLAVGGVGLGMFFLTWGATSFFGDRWLVEQQARQFSEAWLTAVFSGQLGQAHQASLRVRARQPLGTDLEAFYENDEIERAARDVYFQEPVPARLAKLRGGHFRFDRTIEISFESDYIFVALRFLVFATADAQQPELTVQMEMLRETDKDGVYWTLIYVSDAAEVDQRMQSRVRHRPSAG